MTAYGYVFEVFDALYSGDAHEMQTLHDRFFGDYCLELLGRGRSSISWRCSRCGGASCAASPWMLFAISTSVAVGMWLERYMILVTSLYRDFLVSSWGDYHADVLGLGDLSRHHRAVPGAVPADHPACCPVISIFETKEVLHEEQEEIEHGPAHDRYGLLAEFETPEALIGSRQGARARKATAISMPSRRFRSTSSSQCCGCTTVACYGSACSAAFSASRSRSACSFSPTSTIRSTSAAGRSTRFPPSRWSLRADRPVRGA